jgi:hypothetical protein
MFEHFLAHTRTEREKERERGRQREPAKQPKSDDEAEQHKGDLKHRRDEVQRIWGGGGGRRLDREEEEWRSDVLKVLESSAKRKEGSHKKSERRTRVGTRWRKRRFCVLQDEAD